MAHDDDLDDFFARPRRPVAVADPPAARPARRRAPSRPAGGGRRPSARPSARTTRTTRTTRSAPPPRSSRTDRPAPSTRRSSGPARPAPGPRPPRRPIPPVDGATAMRRTRRRMIGFVVVVVLLAVAITAKLIDIQATQRAFWVERGEQARDTSRTIAAGRGTIYDRYGRVLALSVSRPNIVADPSQITDPTDRGRAATTLAGLLGLDRDDVLAKLSAEGSRYQVLAPAVDHETEKKVADALAEDPIAGIALEPTYVREYPVGATVESVIGRTYPQGLVGEDGRRGKYGLELALDDRLTGTPGTVSYEQDSQGNPIPGTPARTEPAVPGQDLHLTLDASLQYATEQLLTRQVADTGAAEAMAVITRPSTGDILAMVSVAAGEDGEIAPTIDNRAATTIFEPGSVNKVITIAGAMEDGVVAPDSVLEVPDNLTLYDHTFTDHDPHPPLAWSTTDVLVTSSNIGTIKIAQQLGKDRVDHYLRAFGLGERTSTEVPGEVNGLMLDPEDWSGTSIGAIPIGQGLSVTALQMLTAYNVIANDGVFVPPRLIGAVDAGEGRVPEDAEGARRVVSTETAQATREMLAKVVAEGTGSNAAVPGFTAYGKTGTARIPQLHPTDPTDAYLGEDGRYDYQSSFLGGIEGADLSIIVTVREAETSIYGGEVAAPLFAELAVLALRTLDVPPPAVQQPLSPEVPDLSSTARDVDAEGPSSGASAAQG